MKRKGIVLCLVSILLAAIILFVRCYWMYTAAESDPSELVDSLLPPMGEPEEAIPFQRLLAQGSQDRRSSTSAVKLVTRVDYALSLSYWDQISGASGHVQSHQCWAAKMASRIVEPFVIDTSYLGGLTSGMNASNATRLGDLFDLKHWNQRSIENGLSPLIDWEEFLQTAPRQVILVRNNWRQVLKNEPFRCEEQDFEKLRTFWTQFLKAHDFEIFRYVCVDLTKPSELTKRIVDQNSDIHVTVVIDDWRKAIGVTGASLPYILKTSNCDKHFYFNIDLTFLKPSPKAMKDADLFISEYLNTNHKYIAVMTRWELTLSKKTRCKACLVKILETVTSLQQQKNISLIFIATDAGYLGSDRMARATRYTDIDIKIRTESMNCTQELLRILYKPPISLAEYEKQFFEVVQLKNPAYVSIVQKVISAKAECLLRLPAKRNYQKQTLMMYQEFHGGAQCTEDIQACPKHLSN